MFFRRQQAGELLVAFEQKLHSLCVVGEGGFAVAGIHGAVESLMGFDQCGRHGERVVEVGERALRELRTGIQHGLGGGFYGCVLFVCWFFRPRVVVVDDTRRIAITAFQSSAGIAHPRHVHGGSEDAEVIERGIGNGKTAIGGNVTFIKKAARNVGTVFG